MRFHGRILIAIVNWNDAEFSRIRSTTKLAMTTATMTTTKGYSKGGKYDFLSILYKNHQPTTSDPKFSECSLARFSLTYVILLLCSTASLSPHRPGMTVTHINEIDDQTKFTVYGGSDGDIRVMQTCFSKTPSELKSRGMEVIVTTTAPALVLAEGLVVSFNLYIRDLYPLLFSI